MQPTDPSEDLSTAEIHHDLQTLLARIRLATDLLHTQDQALLRAIHQDITTCQSLIRQQFDPTDAPKEGLIPTDLNVLIQEEITLLEISQQTVLEQDLCAGPLRVEMQRLAIKRVLTNLLVNALHYGQGWARISSGSTLENVWFQIDDDGPGIDPERQQQLFQPWVRGAKIPPNENLAVGSGLGLAIVEKIVNAHHGRLHLSSNIHKGLTIQVILPRQQPPSPQSLSDDPRLKQRIHIPARSR